MPQIEEQKNNDENSTAPEHENDEVVSYGEWHPRRQIPGNHPYRRRL